MVIPGQFPVHDYILLNVSSSKQVASLLFVSAETIVIIPAPSLQLLVEVTETTETRLVRLNVVVLCRLLVGAPWSGFNKNRKGDVYKCPVSNSGNRCDKLNLQGTVCCVLMFRRRSGAQHV